MFCTNCGEKIPSGAKFCGHCGKPVSSPGTPAPEAAQTCSVQTAPALLTSLKGVSKYKGTPLAGYSAASGTLSVYQDRLEFKRKTGSALSARGGAIGLGISKAMAKDDPIEVYELEQISELREGKYMGLYNTLAVALKNGEVWSFCPVLPNSSEPKKIIALLKPYMQH